MISFVSLEFWKISGILLLDRSFARFYTNRLGNRRFESQLASHSLTAKVSIVFLFQQSRKDKEKTLNSQSYAFSAM